MTTTTQTRRRSRVYCRPAAPTVIASAPELPRNEILLGDAAEILAGLPPGSVDTVITSPPYYNLRNYGAAGQLGAENNIQEWVDALVRVCDEIGRLLAPHGSLWLNLGDSFSRHSQFGAPPKGLLLGPERVLLALAKRGWIVRSKVVWAKTNPRPNPAVDRLSTTWEPIYLLVRSRDYFFDLDRIRVPHISRRTAPRHLRLDVLPPVKPDWAGRWGGTNHGLNLARAEGRPGHSNGRNPGDLWREATSTYRGAHFATFPPKLIERPLLATCPKRVCTICGVPWKPVHGQEPVAACECDGGWRPGLVLDPFMGAGTVAVTARKHRRDWLGVELNPVYRKLALKRLAGP